MKKNEKKLWIGGPLTGYFYLSLFAFCVYAPFSSLFTIPYVMIILSGLTFLIFALIYGRQQYAFSDSGITRYIFGIPYRHIKWEDIIQAVELYSGQKDYSRGILFTVKGGTVYPIENNRYIINKDVFQSILRGKCMFIIYDAVGYSKETKQETVPFVEAHYGKLDYVAEKNPNDPRR